MKSIVRVFSYLRRYPALACGQLFCAVSMTLALVFFPKIVQHVQDEIVPTGDVSELVKFTLFALAAFALREGLNASRILLNNRLEQNVVYDIRSELYAKIQRLPVTWFNTRRTGDVMTRVTEDVMAMERVLIDGIEQGLVAALQVLVFGVVLMVINWQVGLAAAAPIPFLALAAWLYSRNARSRYKAQRDASSDLNSVLHDNISGIRQIKSFTAESEEHARFNQKSDTLRRAALRLMRYWAAYSPGGSFLQMCGYVLVLGFGSYGVMLFNATEGVDGLSRGELIQFFLSLSLFYEPIGRLHQLNQMALSSRAAADRVFEILDAEEEDNVDDGTALAQPVRGEIAMENVVFSYGDEPTLQGVSLRAEPGQTIALVGSTGAGKSTIVNLLSRFYEYDSGTISVDGLDISEASKKSLRGVIGYVSQEAFLFNGTVRENMVLAKREASDEQIWQALESARAADFVRRLPEQLDTNVGERGVKLSGGEKQRLSIARALLKDPPILLLDEATASVDSETEARIQAALDELMRDRTAVVIAHRLSTIQNADRIYVLERGRVIEEGKHDELIALGGRYAELSRQSFLAEQRDSEGLLG